MGWQSTTTQRRRRPGSSTQLKRRERKAAPLKRRWKNATAPNEGGQAAPPNRRQGKVAPPRTPPKGGQATPRNRRQGRKQLHPIHHPKEEQAKQHHCAGTWISRGHRNRCEGTATRAAWNVTIVPKRRYLRYQHGCSLARRDETTRYLPGRLASVSPSINQQQQQTVRCATPVYQVKEMERLIAAANCVRYFEIVKKTNKLQKFNSEFLSSYIESQFLSCLGRDPFGFLLLVFYFSNFSNVFIVFLSFLNCLPAEPKNQ